MRHNYHQALLFFRRIVLKLYETICGPPAVRYPSFIPKSIERILVSTEMRILLPIEDRYLSQQSFQSSSSPAVSLVLADLASFGIATVPFPEPVAASFYKFYLDNASHHSHRRIGTGVISHDKQGLAHVEQDYLSSLVINVFHQYLRPSSKPIDQYLPYSIQELTCFDEDHGDSNLLFHRDRYIACLKAFLFLPSVNDSQGPFQYIKHSHRDFYHARDPFSLLRPLHPSDVPGNITTLVTPTPLLVFADTRGLHRRSPMSPSTNRTTIRFNSYSSYGRKTILSSLIT